MKIKKAIRRRRMALISDRNIVRFVVVYRDRHQLFADRLND